MTGLKRLIGTTAFKLSFLYMVVAALFAGGLITYVGSNARHLIDAQIGQTLNAQINGLADQYRIGGIRRLQTIIERRSRQPGAFILLLQGPAGETLAGNVTGVALEALQAGVDIQTAYQRLEDGEGVPQTAARSALVRVLPLPGNNRLMVGRDLEERERLNTVLTQAIRLLIVALLGFGGLGAFVVARRALARMDALTATSQRIMAGDLSGRLPVSGSGDEVDRLAQNLNAMLERIGELMQGMKEVSDNVAHDLRTPLTRLRNSAEEALRTRRTAEEYQQALERILAESDGLIRTFNALLMIARAEAGSGSDVFRAVDVSALLTDMGELYEPAAEEAGVTISVSAQPDVVVNGNRELLAQALANLIDNALKYGLSSGEQAGSRLDISLSRDGPSVLISVADHGPGIPVADRKRALERFQRLDSSRSLQGSGLGLSLVQAVTRLHKGELLLSDNAPGLKVSLVLPAA